MNKLLKIYLIIILITVSFMNFYTVKANDEVKITPVQAHGKLHVDGKYIKDKNGKIFQIRGVSTHGIGLTSYYSKYINQDGFNYMRNEWKINAVRLTLYSAPDCRDRVASPEEVVKQGVEYAKNAGLYVIIDWHVLKEGDPNTYKDDAIEFFKEMATSFKDDVNVIYEICNEPNSKYEEVTWKDHVKPYAEDVIKEIRKIDDDAIIAVGSSTWSQDVDLVTQDPITDYDNLVYTLHFYAGSHKEKLRNKLKAAADAGLPLFISEFGACNASGDGGINYEEAEKWMDLLNENNIGFIIWQLTNKAEGSSLIRNDVSKLTDWTYDELSDHGKWFVDTLKQYQDDNKIVNQTYDYISGEDQIYTIGNDNVATFRINAEYSLFENGGKVYVDDELVNRNNYTSKSGSTIIILKKEYISSLSEGRHTLKVVFNNDGTAITNFTVTRAGTATEKNSSEETTEKTVTPNTISDKTKITSKNPKTSDNGIVIWVELIIFSMLGLVGTVLYSKKK